MNSPIFLMTKPSPNLRSSIIGYLHHSISNNQASVKNNLTYQPTSNSHVPNAAIVSIYPQPQVMYQAIFAIAPFNHKQPSLSYKCHHLSTNLQLSGTQSSHSLITLSYKPRSHHQVIDQAIISNILSLVTN